MKLKRISLIKEKRIVDVLRAELKENEDCCSYRESEIVCLRNDL